MVVSMVLGKHLTNAAHGAVLPQHAMVHVVKSPPPRLLEHAPPSLTCATNPGLQLIRYTASSKDRRRGYLRDCHLGHDIGVPEEVRQVDEV